MGVLLKDVAKALNLSKATVSWILSGKGEEKGFSDATIKLVKESAARMGYSPNLLARSLSLGSTHTIALIIPAIGDTFYSQMAQAVEKQAHKCGYTLIISSSESNAEKERQLIRALRAQQVDGLIIAPSKGELSAICSMMEEHYPFVFIDRYYPELETNYVIVDNEESSCCVVSRLIGAGSPTDRTAHDRYASACDGAPYPGLPQCSLRRGNRARSGIVCRGKSGELCRGGCCGTRCAVRALSRCRWLFSSQRTTWLLKRCAILSSGGIDYRRRFRFACFHTTTALDILAPEMLVTQMPIEEMGTRAVDMLLENIRDRGKFRPQGVVLQNRISG